MRSRPLVVDLLGCTGDPQRRNGVADVDLASLWDTLDLGPAGPTSSRGLIDVDLAFRARADLEQIGVVDVGHV